MMTLSPKRDPGLSVEDLYRFTVAQYHALAGAAILDEDAPVELLEGWLVCKYGPFDAFPSPYLAPEAEEAGDLTLAWIWRFTVDQYHALIDAGILTEEDPVELLGGWLVRKMTPRGPAPTTRLRRPPPPHPIAVEQVREALATRLSGTWYVRTQAPITLPDSEPEPDLALVRGDRRDYLQRHPGPADVVLVVEVADISPARDRGIKKQTYAHAGIPVYWIVNLTEQKIECYTKPSGAAATPDYAQHRDYGITEAIPVVIDGVEVGRLDVRELLP